MDWRTLQQKVQAKPDPPEPGRGHPASRLRQLAITVGLVVVLAVGVGAWFFTSQGAGPTRVSGSQDTLVSTTLTTARDVGSFLRESVTRDLAIVANLLKRFFTTRNQRQDTLTTPTPRDPRPGAGCRPDQGQRLSGHARDNRLAIVANLLKRSDEESSEAAATPVPRQRRRAPTAPPELYAGIEPMPWAELPRDAPLFMVFDESHADVTPPGVGDIRLRSKFLPPSLFPSDRAQESRGEGETDSDSEQVAGLVEVIVSEKGEVERAKLISVPNNVHESMLLSAIKAWHFTPAEKDGVAVRYRQVMPITVAR